MKHAVSLSAFALAVLATPVAGHAQHTFQVSIGSGGGGEVSASTNANATPGSAKADTNAIMSSKPGILSVDDTTPAGPISTDSLAHIKNYVKAHRPVIIIDHKVKGPGDLSGLKASGIATYKIQEAGDKDLTYYGKAAENGIMTITLVPPPPPAPKKKR